MFLAPANQIDDYISFMAHLSRVSEKTLGQACVWLLQVALDYVQTYDLWHQLDPYDSIYHGNITRKGKVHYRRFTSISNTIKPLSTKINRNLSKSRNVSFAEKSTIVYF